MKKRNGLLEIYRFILCFWPLYYHNYFFFKRDYSKFTLAELAVDFFFIISGFFLMRSMRKLKDEPIFKGVAKLMFGRVKPMMFTLCFISVFNLVCILLFIRGNYFDTLFELFKYWWFVLYLTVVIGILYLIYRLVKSERIFASVLALLVIGMTCLHYSVVELKMFTWEIVFFTRSIGCVSAGVLISYIPALKVKKFNPAIPITALLIPLLLILAYFEKTFIIALSMVLMFGALVYFSSNISFGGAVCDILGKLSVRMYLYMAFITMLEMLGLTNYRVLFVIDLSIATMDLAVCYWRDKYIAMKKQQDKSCC